MSKEQSVISNITNLFSNEKLLLQHSVLGYKIDLHFPKHKLATEVYEKGHTDREKLVCEFVKEKKKKKIMMSILNLIKYAITLMNQMKK